MRGLLNNPHPAGVGILRGRAVTWGGRECRMHALYLQTGLEWVRMADRTTASVNTWAGGWVSYKSWKREAALDGGQRKRGSIMSSRAMQGQPRDGRHPRAGVWASPGEVGLLSITADSRWGRAWSARRQTAWGPGQVGQDGHKGHFMGTLPFIPLNSW